MEQSSFKSSIPIQIRFNDIDALGHINNNVYLSYFDLGKNAYFKSLEKHLLNRTIGAMVLARIEMDFLKPVMLNENVAVSTKVVRLGNKSGEFYQEIHNTKTGELRCYCKSVFVYFDLQTKDSAPIPENWREAISRFEEKEL